MLIAEQLQFIQQLHKLRTPLLDKLISWLNFFDTQEFLFVLLPVVWIMISWQWGIRLYYLLSINHIFNFALKNAFSLPRPFHLESSLGLLHIKGFGFPSGAAQTATLLAALFVINSKFKWKWPFALFYVFLISFSRLYLGVHFPMDIFGGWIAGLIMVALYLYLFPLVESRLVKLSPIKLLLMTELLFATLFLFVPFSTIKSIASCAMGLGLGIFFHQCSLHTLGKECLLIKTCKIALCILGTFLIAFLFPKFLPQSFLSFIPFFSIGLWITFFSNRRFVTCSK